MAGSAETTGLTLDQMVKEAESASAEKDWLRAAELWSAVFSSSPQDEVWCRAGRRAAQAYRQAGDLENARAYLAAVFKLFPDDALVRRELGRLDQAISEKQKSYHDQRSHLIYYEVVRRIATRIVGNANSVIDVGSEKTPVLSWFPNVPVRVALDLRRPYAAEGITSVKANFLEWEAPQTFDVGLCLQVLEHIPDVEEFAIKLMNICEILIISVPYKWTKGKTRFHVHDPVDEKKLGTWFGREPNYSYIVREINGTPRIICVYDSMDKSSLRNIEESNYKYRWSLRGADNIIGT